MCTDMKIKINCLTFAIELLESMISVSFSEQLGYLNLTRKKTSQPKNIENVTFCCNWFRSKLEFLLEFLQWIWSENIVQIQIKLDSCFFLGRKGPISMLCKPQTEFCQDHFGMNFFLRSINIRIKDELIVHKESFLNWMKW